MAVAERIERHGSVERLHVARTVGGGPLYWTSVYRVGDVLVDTGCASCRAAVGRFVAKAPVTAVLTTHHHEDHVGNHGLFLPRSSVPPRPPSPPLSLGGGQPGRAAPRPDAPRQERTEDTEPSEERRPDPPTIWA
ncbi:MAG TPA: MBL fold metallo-hydrolase, partial [Candidatus Thermoplasmatota archaeon]|nr:MBL fold metallo-hydrolase [Candidatus Thermoplasmatota archaeon]